MMSEPFPMIFGGNHRQTITRTFGPQAEPLDFSADPCPFDLIVEALGM